MYVCILPTIWHWFSHELPSLMHTRVHSTNVTLWVVSVQSQENSFSSPSVGNIKHHQVEYSSTRTQEHVEQKNKYMFACIYNICIHTHTIVTLSEKQADRTGPLSPPLPNTTKRRNFGIAASLLSGNLRFFDCNGVVAAAAAGAAASAVVAFSSSTSLVPGCLGVEEGCHDDRHQPRRSRLRALRMREKRHLRVHPFVRRREF